MATATQPTTPAADRRGFPGLSCPACGQQTLAVRVSEVELVCTDCGEEITLQQARVIAATWAALVEWLDHAPPLPE